MCVLKAKERPITPAVSEVVAGETLARPAPRVRSGGAWATHGLCGQWSSCGVSIAATSGRTPGGRRPDNQSPLQARRTEEAHRWIRGPPAPGDSKSPGGSQFRPTLGTHRPTDAGRRGSHFRLEVGPRWPTPTHSGYRGRDVARPAPRVRAGGARADHGVSGEWPARGLSIAATSRKLPPAAGRATSPLYRQSDRRGAPTGTRWPARRRGVHGRPAGADAASAWR
jgi:hypothetical protein